MIAHDLVYSLEAIHHLVLQLEEQEREWWAWFNDAGLAPRTVVYEHFVDDYEGTALDLLEFLGIRDRGRDGFAPRRMTRQSDELNDQWLQRYLREIGTGVVTLPASSAQ